MRRPGLVTLAGAAVLATAGIAAAPASARTFVSIGVGAPVYPGYGYGYGYRPAYYPGYYPAYYGAPVVVGGYYGRGYYGRPGWRGGYYGRGGYGRGGYGHHGWR